MVEAAGMHVPAPFRRGRRARPPLRVPSWARALTRPSPDADVATVIAAESAGENADDLFAAAVVAAETTEGDARFRIRPLDDGRDPGAACAAARRALAEAVPDGSGHRAWPAAVVGHFSSPVACRVADLYATAGVPFFAPGSSADGLCAAARAPVFQLCPRDAGQVDGLLRALRDRQGPVQVVAERDNAGETLGQALASGLAASDRAVDLRAVHRAADAAAAPTASALQVVLGSKEFALAWLETPAAGRAAALYLSDDAHGMAAIAERVAARDLNAYTCRIAAPAAYALDSPVVQLHRRARALLGRAPGPYFDTSFLAFRLAARAWGDGARAPADVLARLRRGSWRTPFGPLTFGVDGHAEGMSWELCPVPRPDGRSAVLGAAPPV